MKQISQLVVPLFLTVFLLFSFSITSSGRLLPPLQLQGEQLVKTEIQEDDLFHLMGLEAECDGRDEDCIKRRMIAEAHLDYIYTQHHKPKGSP